ncbi:MAG: riboflavin synthase [Propionibacteriaceae bacterium]|nr:riboflavin synthase [Propionibacteriaceae bacterium]
MFTGLIQQIGTVAEVTEQAGGRVIRLTAPTLAAAAAVGDSIAVAGVCLTVTGRTDTDFTADVMTETLRVTTLGQWRPGVAVNLEPAMAVTGRLGGHIVQGHVDGVGQLLERQPGAQWETFRFTLPPELARYVAIKGSIAIDGVSLTVADLAADSFTIGLIPTTLRDTTLGGLQPGDRVNLEVDVIAKYVARLSQWSTTTSDPDATTVMEGNNA